MADSYSGQGATPDVTASPGDTALTVVASTLTRADIEHFALGHSGAPDDKSISWLVRRFTAEGVATALTPTLLDPDAPASQLTYEEDATTEPTYASNSELWDEPLNQRATWQLWTSPKFAFKIPATANNGIGFTPISATYVLPAEATALWIE